MVVVLGPGGGEDGGVGVMSAHGSGAVGIGDGGSGAGEMEAVTGVGAPPGVRWWRHSALRSHIDDVTTC